MKIFCILLLFFIPLHSKIHSSINLSSYLKNYNLVAIYDENFSLSLVDPKTSRLKTSIANLGRVNAMASSNSGLVVAFSDGDLVFYDNNLNILSVFKSGIVDIEKLLMHGDKIYAIADKNTLFEFDLVSKNKVFLSQKFGRINDLILVNDFLCTGGWDKQVSCYDDGITLVKKIKNDNIVTSLCLCNNHIYASNIDNFIVNLTTEAKYKFDNNIISMNCLNNSLFVASKNKIYKLSDNGFKKISQQDDDIFSIYGTNSLIVVMKNGKILTF